MKSPSGSCGGQTRNRIARLDAATGLADSFDPNANSVVTSIAVGADGKILVGGPFSTIGGATRRAFARLSPDTAARQNLAVTQSSVTWTRGGRRLACTSREILFLPLTFYEPMTTTSNEALTRVGLVTPQLTVHKNSKIHNTTCL